MTDGWTVALALGSTAIGGIIGWGTAYTSAHIQASSDAARLRAEHDHADRDAVGAAYVAYMVAEEGYAYRAVFDSVEKFYEWRLATMAPAFGRVALVGSPRVRDAMRQLNQVYEDASNAVRDRQASEADEALMLEQEFGRRDAEINTARRALLDAMRAHRNELHPPTPPAQAGGRLRRALAEVRKP